MNILITGANGFMGRHLVRVLSRGHYVIAGTRTECTIEGASENRVLPTLDSEGDWDDSLRGVDVIVHLAARVHVMKETAEDPLESFRNVNAIGTRRLAEAASVQGVKRFIFMSSIKVNGEGGMGRPYSDEDAADPLDPYGISKWEAEEHLSSIAQESSMEVVVLRSPVVYGAGVKGNIERMARLVHTQLPLPFGKVNNQRMMLSLSNLSLWVEAAITAKDLPKRPVLMGDPRAVSTKELVIHLGKGMGRKPLLLPIPISLMEAGAAMIGMRQVAQRLFSSLEVSPSFNSFPGLYEKLKNPGVSLENLGKSYR